MRSKTGALLFLAALTGAAIGIAVFTFGYAKGASYLSNNPQACANCHIMREHLDGWIQASHRKAATCNDCHTPPGLVTKYLVKASNGFHHSVAFTTGRFAEPIRIKPHNRAITEDNCRRCHQEIVAAIDPPVAVHSRTSCLKCHSDVGHRS